MIQKLLKFSIYLVSLFLLSIFLISSLRYKTNPAAIFKYLIAQIGSSVGVSLTVPENPFNNLVKQFQEKEMELKEREEKVNEMLMKIERESRIILSLILILIIILFFLLLLNFYFDYRTRKLHRF